jgi:3-phosphoshikimate 1-carboxyvinyltransferase
MSRIATPLTAMGARVHTAPGGTPPVVIRPAGALHGRRHDLPVASAQVKSCLLLAGLGAEGETWVSEPAPSRDHTERMLAAAEVPVLHADGAVGVSGPRGAISLPDLTVPGDFSSAAFHIVAGALRADPEIRLRRVNLNPTRTGLLAVLERMGADVRVEAGEPMAGEPCGDLVVRRAEGLRATTVGLDEVPAMVDELPLLGLVGAVAAGVTSVRGAAELRAKESDRIAAVCRALRAVGVEAVEHEDGFDVHGAGRIVGGEVDAGGDHRLAMWGAVAGLASDAGVSVRGFEAVAVSYPGFARDLAAIGAVA